MPVNACCMYMLIAIQFCILLIEQIHIAEKVPTNFLYYVDLYISALV